MLPDKPGRYPLRFPDGRKRLVKVQEQGSQLVAILGRWIPVAVPVANVPGKWLERMK